MCFASDALHRPTVGGMVRPRSPFRREPLRKGEPFLWGNAHYFVLAQADAQ